MADAPMKIRGIYRATSHLPIWAVLQEAGIWEQVGLELTSFEFVDDSSVAERALLGGDVDFISGNHISTYTQFMRGQPIVHLTSPGNSVHDSVITREKISSVADLQGVRLGDTAQLGPEGGYAHPRGNHMLYLLREGLKPSQVQWVELAAKNGPEFDRAQMAALKEGRIDATFVSGGAAQFEEAGFHMLRPERLPMINGPTITCSSTTLARRPGLGERLVKAEVLGIHYAHAHPDETNRTLADLSRQQGWTRVRTAESITRYPRKPYPDVQAVANAYELACMQVPETREISPLSLWDMHYLRELDDSGFIDRLYAWPWPGKSE
jgi:ABC-type nitrate/sulfonate/bicarbonate transport system substrate-binding protein